jgi:hypothetical protein
MTNFAVDKVVPILRPRKEIPWMVGMSVLKSASTLQLQPLLTNVNLSLVKVTLVAPQIKDPWHLLCVA